MIHCIKWGTFRCVWRYNKHSYYICDALYSFDNVLWKVKWINKFLGIPNLNGVWKGMAKSSFDESKEYSMELTVKQTWSKISFVSEFLDTNSKSQSNSAAFLLRQMAIRK